VIEQGLVILIQSGLSGLTPAVPGGFAVMLQPKDLISAAVPMAWTYRSIVSEPDYVLAGQTGYTALELQIDCHGLTMANAIGLARGIDAVLRGNYAGTLADPDHTVVYGIQRQGPFLDGYADANRSYVRTLEYKIQYAQA